MTTHSPLNLLVALPMLLSLTGCIARHEWIGVERGGLGYGGVTADRALRECNWEVDKRLIKRTGGHRDGDYHHHGGYEAEGDYDAAHRPKRPRRPQRPDGPGPYDTEDFVESCMRARGFDLVPVGMR